MGSRINGSQPPILVDDDEEDDDQPVGRILNRREVLAMFGLAGAALLVGCSESGDDSTSTASSAAPTGTTQTLPATSTTSAAASTPTTAVTSTTDAATTTEGNTAADDTETTTSVATEDAVAQATETLASVPACVVSPELTEGPYFVDEGLNRADVRSDPATGVVSEGTTLQLALRALRVDGSGCAPLQDATVDIWHCDADGVYSDTSDPGFNTVGQQFLRGYQVTDTTGLVQFTTIYPGWYQGRAVHIHFKIRGQDSSGSTYEFTSQFFFDESMTDEVHAEEPYASKGYRTLLNDGDGIYRDGGDQLVLTVTKADDGYLGTFDIGVHVS